MRVRIEREDAFLTELCFDEHEPYFPADGPYYSSCGYFRPSRLPEVLGFWRRTIRLMREGRAPREAGLYLHWPFCPSRCAFCFCSMAVPGRAGMLEAAAESLKREMDAFAPVFSELRLDSVYLGGGTPTFLPDALLDDLLEHLRVSFALAREAEVYAEASPATLTAAKLEILLRRGVNRITLGVQSNDPAVLRRAGRAQTPASVRRALALLASAPGLYSGVELMLGLEGQALGSFLRDLLFALRARPNAVYVYGFDPRPQTLFARAGKRPAPEELALRERLLPQLERLAREHGYRVPPVRGEDAGYLSTISAQCREARRRGASILGLGPSALSHAFGAAWYRHPPAEELDLGRAAIPPFYALESGLAEEARGFAIRHLYSGGSLPRAQFRELFGRDPLAAGGVGGALRAARAAGELREVDGALALADSGRARRLVFTKRLYSPRVRGLILARHRRALRDWRPNGASARGTAALLATFARVGS